MVGASRFPVRCALWTNETEFGAYRMRDAATRDGLIPATTVILLKSLALFETQFSVLKRLLAYYWRVKRQNIVDMLRWG